MKERPIIYKGNMVRAILDGRKNQTRRVIKSQESVHGPCQDGKLFWVPKGMYGDQEPNCKSIPLIEKCPYGKPGDRLWVKETFAVDEDEQPVVYYRATDHESCGQPWKPSIYMPRWASRITLEVKNIRVERVRDISEEDAIAEGIIEMAFVSRKGLNSFGYSWCWDRVGEHSEYSPDGIIREEDICLGTARHAFGNLWNSINEKRGYGWDKNPWVWVIEFERVERCQN